jgi:hypothetical protein
MGFTNSPGNELGDLGAKIQDQYSLMLHLEMDRSLKKEILDTASFRKLKDTESQ